MQVLVNKQTGLAEELNDQQAHAAIYSGTHEVPLIDANGQIGSSPFQDAQQMVASGTHSQPNPEQLHGMLSYTKHSSPMEQAKTFAEGAAEAATLGLSTPIQVGMGISTPEDIHDRRETNPNAHMAGQVSGLIGALALPGGAAAGAMKVFGEGAEAVTAGLGAGKLLSAGSRLAAEGSLFQAGDEVSKKFEQDPNQTVQSAILNTGLAALTAPILGGAVAGSESLWNATAGKTLGSYMKAAREKLAQGVGEGLPVSKELLDKYPEIKPVLGDNPTAEQTHQFLLNSPSKGGERYRADVNEFRKGSVGEALGAMGYSEDDIPALKDASSSERGQEIAKMIGDDVKSRYEPFKKAFSNIEKKYGGVELGPVDKTDIGSKISDLADSEGYNLSPSSPEAQEVKRLTEEIPNLNTVEDLRKYRSIFDGNASQKQLWGLRRKVLNVLDDARDNAVTNALGATEGPEALQFHQETNKAYRGLMSHIEDLNDRLRVGKYAGPESFINNLKEMRPEDVLNRLNPKNDAGLIGKLQNDLPQVADAVRKHQLEQLIKTSTRGDQFNLKTFVNKLDAANTSPETREFLLGKEAYDKVKGIKEMLDDLPHTDNPSGTAKAAGRIFGKIPFHLGAGALLAHGNPILAGLSELAGGLLTREIPDAARVSWLRFLGNGQLPINPAAFKAVAETAHNAARGFSTINNAVRSVLAGHIAPEEALTDSKKKKLEDLAETYSSNPEKFIDSDNHLAAYEPNHAAAQSSVLVRAATAIINAKPKTQGLGILDSKMKPSKIQQADYHRTLQMIENPKTIFNRISRGNVNPTDISTLKTVYPDVYSHIVQKFTDEMIDAKSSKSTIPYKIRLGMSMFMGQPLDSTMSPTSIMSNQPAPIAGPAAPPQPKGSKKALNDLPGSYETASQSREQKRAMR